MALSADDGTQVAATYLCNDEDLEEYSDNYNYTFFNNGEFSLRSLRVSFHNYTWIDGGCFCSASFQRDGFHRSLMDENSKCVDHIIIPAN